MMQRRHWEPAENVFRDAFSVILRKCLPLYAEVQQKNKRKKNTFNFQKKNVISQKTAGNIMYCTDIFPVKVFFMVAKHLKK